MEMLQHRAYARAGLIGNPSDGYGGKTIAFTIPSLYADVVLYEWEELEVIPSQEDRGRFGSSTRRRLRVRSYRRAGRSTVDRPA